MILVTTTGGSVLFPSFIKVNYTQALFLLWSLNYWILCSLSVLEWYYRANIRQTQIWFGLPMQSLCSKADSVLSALQMAVEKFVCTRVFFTFLGYLWFWIGNIKVARWNGLEILIPKHMWKSKIGLLEEIWAQNPYVTFFLGPLCLWQCFQYHLYSTDVSSEEGGRMNFERAVKMGLILS